jgi:hypothetical protein
MVSEPPGKLGAFSPLSPIRWLLFSPINIPHRRLPSWAPLSPPPPPVCGYVSGSLTPPSSPSSHGVGGRNSGILALSPLYPPPTSSRPRLSVGQFVCLLLLPLLWVFPAEVMELVAMATASVYRTHTSQSPLTLSLPSPLPNQAVMGSEQLQKPSTHLET